MPGTRSPRISGLSWGRLEIEGGGRFKDGKLYPGGSREWDWSETGTRHVPGIQPADVAELLEHGSRVIVLASGFFGRLRVEQRTLEMLRGRGLEVHLLRTESAVARYNELRERAAVGGLFHTTC